VIGRPLIAGSETHGSHRVSWVRMNWAESIYINSGLRTKRLRRSVIPKLIALGGRTEGLEVLDIGCGPGECVAGEIEDFGARRVTAIDVDPKMVQRASGRLAKYGDRVAVVEGDVTNLPYQNEAFDAVFNFAVLHHVPDWRAGLQEIARVLKARGRLFSQDHDVANHDWLSRHLFVHPPDRFTNVDFLDQVTTVGLRPLAIDDQPEQLLVAALKH
jgi:ubiquinone/menaquinone biosynthesis C-methylase UbiE